MVDETVAGDATRPAAVATDLRVAGLSIRRYVVATQGHDLSPPAGLGRLPRPGEVAVSPALAALAREDARIARLLAPEAGSPWLIAPDGLLWPDELVVWSGVDRAALEPDQAALQGFGQPVVLPEVLHRTYWPLFGVL